MNETDAVVVRLEGDYAWVRAVGPGPACGACAQKEGCSSAGLEPPVNAPTGNSRKQPLLRLPNTIHAAPGDSVVIRAPDGMVLRAVWLAYGVPLLLGIGGAMVATALWGDGLVALSGLLIGLASGFIMVKRRRLEPGRGEPILSLRFKQSSIISVKGQETC